MEKKRREEEEEKESSIKRCCGRLYLARNTTSKVHPSNFVRRSVN